MSDCLCPKCKIPMKTQEFVEVNLETCGSCEGLFFDKSELRKITDIKGSNMKINESVSEDEIVRNDKSNAINCPKCKNIMARNTYADSDISIDNCEVCGGVWLDAGEFTAIYNYIEAAEEEFSELDPEIMEKLEKIKKEQNEKFNSSFKQNITANSWVLSKILNKFFKK